MKNNPELALSDEKFLNQLFKDNQQKKENHKVVNSKVSTPLSNTGEPSSSFREQLNKVLERERERKNKNIR